MGELGYCLQLSGIVQIIPRRDGFLDLLDGPQLPVPLPMVTLFQVHAAICPSADECLANPALLAAHAALVRRPARVVKDMLEARREHFGLELRVAHQIGEQDIIGHRGGTRLGSIKGTARREGQQLRIAGRRCGSSASSLYVVGLLA